MKKEFLPYKLAVQLKNLGFNEECLGSFTIEDNSLQLVDMYNLPSVVKAPLWQQAFDWCLNKIPKYSIRICHNKTGEILSNGNTISLFDDLEECLEKLIELCAKK